MSAKWAHVFFQERKMSAAIFVSASESAAHVFKKERNHERRVSGAHKYDERTKGLIITK